MANLSKTLHINFYQNRSSTVEVVTKNFGVFMQDSVVYSKTWQRKCWTQAGNNNNTNSHDNVYGAVIVAVHCHCESSPGSSDECSTQRQVAADLWTKPISLSQ